MQHAKIDDDSSKAIPSRWKFLYPFARTTFYSYVSACRLSPDNLILEK